MAYFIGTDEAGYGPNLGPLAVTATCWQVSGLTTDLATILGDTVGTDTDQIRLSDSKQVFSSSSKSLLHLETAALVLLQQIGLQPQTVDELVQSLSPDADQIRDEGFWISSPDIQLPQQNTPEQLNGIAKAVATQLAQHSSRFVDVQSRIVTPSEFNRMLGQNKNKADVLATTTLEMIAQWLRSLAETDPHEHVYITCDRFGGRRKYLPLLHEILTDQFIERARESESDSVYIIREKHRKIKIRFVTQGERYIPVAAASIFSKWIRELTMLAWNAFWQSHLPDLKATAGYPGDAPRFKSEIDEVRQVLGISNESIWRQR